MSYHSAQLPLCAKHVQMVCAHGDGKQQQYKNNRVAKGEQWNVRTRQITELGGIDGNSLESEAMPEGGVEPE